MRIGLLLACSIFLVQEAVATRPELLQRSVSQRDDGGSCCCDVGSCTRQGCPTGEHVIGSCVTSLGTALNCCGTTTAGTVPHYGQCGGIGWTGPTTCMAPWTCTPLMPYYSQCL